MAEIIEDRRSAGTWRVERIVEDGAVEQALLLGPNANSRARAYCEWVNRG